MMSPVITGTIDRRILINYQVDEGVLRNILPRPFVPKLVDGKGIAGICLIRLKEIRPKGMPAWIGIASENGAHRIAVEWSDNGVIHEGVYIPRRDTSSYLNNLAGGRIFPGKHHLSKFTVVEYDKNYQVSFTNSDGTSLNIQAAETDQWNSGSIFNNLEGASQFFENGSIGYSPYKNSFEGLELITNEWHVSLLDVERVESSFFEDENMFPKGTVHFDNALLMKGISHDWIGLKKIKNIDNNG